MMRRNLLNKIFCVAPVCAVLLLARAGETQAQTRKPGAIRIPPGVKPLTASHADSLARQLFVPLPAARAADSLISSANLALTKADSVWDILQRAAQSPRQISPEDSLAALQATLEGYQHLQKGVPFIEQYLKQQQETARPLAIGYLQEAEKALVKALELNPFNTQTRTLLAYVYKLLGDRFKDREEYGRAINIWETLVRLEPGEYLHYYNLAHNYFASHVWQKALDNFEAAEQRLLASAEVKDSRIADPAQPVAAALDSNVLFLSVFYQSLSAIKLLHEEKAYASLRRALTLANTSQNRATVQDYLNWMDWDGGYIVGSTMRDSALALSSRGEFRAAGEVYEKLLPKLRTARARNEISWKLALIEFTHLDRKEYAAERLLNVIESIPLGPEGTPPDSLSRLYYDNYGTMCVGLGNDNIEVDRKLAYTYFMQASSINWSGRGKSYFAMATLADADPRQAVRDAEKAYELVHQLDADEVINLHRLLVRCYRRLQQFEKAKMHFAELKRLLESEAEQQAGS